MRERSRRLWIAAFAVGAGCQSYDRNTYNGLVDSSGVDAVDVPIASDAVLDAVPPTDVADAVAMETGSATSDAVVDGPLDGFVDAPSDVAVDSGPDPTSCDDVNAGAIFCDGFENAALAGWSLQRINGAATRSTDRVFRGLGALRAESTAASGYAYLFNHSLGGVTSGELFVRGYYFFPSGVALGRVTFLTAGESVSPYYSTQMRVMSEQVNGYDGAAIRDVITGPASIVPRDRWVCMEFRVLVDDAAGAIDLWMDGVFLGGLAGVDTRAATGYAQLSVGVIGTSATQAPVVVYVDEVVASRTRVGCE